jgi:hypothetical protein
LDVPLVEIVPGPRFSCTTVSDDDNLHETRIEVIVTDNALTTDVSPRLATVRFGSTGYGPAPAPIVPVRKVRLRVRTTGHRVLSQKVFIFPYRYAKQSFCLQVSVMWWPGIYATSKRRGPTPTRIYERDSIGTCTVMMRVRRAVAIVSAVVCVVMIIILM